MNGLPTVDVASFVNVMRISGHSAGQLTELRTRELSVLSRIAAGSMEVKWLE